MLKKTIFSLCLKPLATRRALYLSIVLSGGCWFLAIWGFPFLFRLKFLFTRRISFLNCLPLGFRIATTNFVLVVLFVTTKTSSFRSCFLTSSSIRRRVKKYVLSRYLNFKMNNDKPVKDYHRVCSNHTDSLRVHSKWHFCIDNHYLF